MSGLVNYSDSDDSDTETKPTPTPVAAPAPPPAKKPFQKLINRSNPGKILVNLPQTAGTDEPPAKRARTEGGRGGLLSSFRSALPPPKKTAPPVAAKAATSSSAGGAAPALPFSFFKTSAEAAFSREPVVDYSEDGDGLGSGGSGSSGLKLNLPPPKSQQTVAAAGPSIPAEQKPEAEVKLVGKPLMFRPLSVARKQTARKKATTAIATAKATTTPAVASAVVAPRVSTTASEPVVEKPKEKKSISLFGLGEDEDETYAKAPQPSSSNNAYEPLFEDSSAGQEVYSDYASYQPSDSALSAYTQPNTTTQPQSLDTIADDLNLSAAARRELFGRGGAAASASASKVINFNLDQEYRSNEEMRASGELQAPARTVKGIAPGKHSLQQLVNSVQSQRDALEDSFVKNKSNQKQASSRYGWR